MVKTWLHKKERLNGKSSCLISFFINLQHQNPSPNQMCKTKICNVMSYWPYGLSVSWVPRNILVLNGNGSSTPKGNTFSIQPFVWQISFSLSTLGTEVSNKWIFVFSTQIYASTLDCSETSEISQVQHSTTKTISSFWVCKWITVIWHLNKKIILCFTFSCFYIKQSILK